MIMNRDKLFDYAVRRLESQINLSGDVVEADCDICAYLLNHCEITIPEQNRFFVCVNCEGIQQQIIGLRAARFRKESSAAALSAGQEALAYTGSYDFSHTTAHWESVLSLGIVGLRDRIIEYSEKYENNHEKQKYYTQILKVYNAAICFVERAAESAFQCGKAEMGNGLTNLTKYAPSNLFEAMQTMLIYYVLQHMVEGTYLRTLGRPDQLFYPFYQKENSAVAGRLILDFLKEIDLLKAPSNIPFALGGTDADGNCLINKLSYDLLTAYQNAGTKNTKLHLLCSESMPKDIVMSALDGVRQGNNSIVFMSDKKIIESLVGLGEDYADAIRYHVVGCYECGSDGETTCSCNARVNLVKALEVTLNGGKDMLTGKQIGISYQNPISTFEDLFAAYKRQISYFCQCAMKITDYYEQHYENLHSAPFLSGTYPYSLEKGGDIYCHHTAKYNNSSLNAIGLGTAVDSLAAIKKAVFEEQILSLSELTEILRNNWQGQEALRLFIKNKYPKFGTGDEKMDVLAKRIVDSLSDTVNRKPNKKGGVYRLGLFSIDWRWAFGEKTAASADGRFHGETLSQNTSASFGADKEGATMHLLSVAQIDTSKTPNGTIVDIDLHSSAVKGKNGLCALYSALRAYFQLGGFAVHYNVLDTETLKKAKERPEDYPNLQVRLCGWNVLFSSLSDKEKDEFIARSVKQN